MRADETMRDGVQGVDGEVAVQVRRVFVTARFARYLGRWSVGSVVSAQVDAALGRYEGFLWWFGDHSYRRHGNVRALMGW